MTDEKKQIKQRQYKRSVRDYVDSDYKDKPPHPSLELNENEKQWMYDFENAYYGNNTENLEPDLAKDISNADNARNRDLFTKSRRVIVREADYCKVIHGSYSGYIKESLKKYGLKITVDDLIETKALDIQELDRTNLDALKQELSKLCIDVVKALRLEKRYTEQRRKK